MLSNSPLVRFLSFVVAGLIALTYTEFIDQFLMLCVAYPFLWVDPINPCRTARKELALVERRLRVFQVLSGLIPLAAGIALMVGLVLASPEQRAAAGYQGFLILLKKTPFAVTLAAVALVEAGSINRC